jgi:hypothetical protein
LGKHLQWRKEEEVGCQARSRSEDRTQEVCEEKDRQGQEEVARLLIVGKRVNQVIRVVSPLAVSRVSRAVIAKPQAVMARGRDVQRII